MEECRNLKLCKVSSKTRPQSQSKDKKIFEASNRLGNILHMTLFNYNKIYNTNLSLNSRTCVSSSLQFPRVQHLLPDNNFTNLPSPWIEYVGVCISNWIQMSCQGANHYCPSLWNSVAFKKHKFLKHQLESDMQIHIHYSYISYKNFA